MGQQGVTVEYWKWILKTCAKGTKLRVYNVANETNAYDLWKKLKSMFEQKTTRNKEL